MNCICKRNHTGKNHGDSKGPCVKQYISHCLHTTIVNGGIPVYNRGVIISRTGLHLVDSASSTSVRTECSSRTSISCISNARKLLRYNLSIVILNVLKNRSVRSSLVLARWLPITALVIELKSTMGTKLKFFSHLKRRVLITHPETIYLAHVPLLATRLLPTTLRDSTSVPMMETRQAE